MIQVHESDHCKLCSQYINFTNPIFVVSFSTTFFLVVGYRISVDSRLTFGADQKIIEAEVARKKKEYMKNEELAQIYKLYKSMKVISILIIKNFFFSLIQLMKIIKWSKLFFYLFIKLLTCIYFIQKNRSWSENFKPVIVTSSLLL